MESKLIQVFKKAKHLFFSRHGFLSVISILFFVYMVVIKPFGLQNSNNLFVFAFAYTAIAFLVMELNYILISRVEKYFIDDFFLITKYGIYITINIIGYSIFMWLFYVLVFEQPELTLIDFFIENFIFSVLPIMLFLIFMQNIILQKHVTEANILNLKLEGISIEEEPELISIETDSVKSFFQQPIDHILCVEANDNYSAVYYIANNGKLQREMLRVTLKNVEDQFSNFSHMMRCHKSYIVNIKKIEKVNGNAQGYRLQTHGLDFEIPVSRRFPREILNSIKKSKLHS